MGTSNNITIAGWNEKTTGPVPLVLDHTKITLDTGDTVYEESHDLNKQIQHTKATNDEHQRQLLQQNARVRALEASTSTHAADVLELQKSSSEKNTTVSTVQLVHAAQAVELQALRATAEDAQVEVLGLQEKLSETRGHVVVLVGKLHGTKVTAKAVDLDCKTAREETVRLQLQLTQTRTNC